MQQTNEQLLVRPQSPVLRALRAAAPQLTDVEDEVNGLFTYDRAAVKPDANAVRSVNAALAAEFARVTNPAKK